MKPDAALGREQFCYLTTRGRSSGKPHEIEIWFALADGTLYLLAGSGHRADWVRNLIEEPAVSLRIADRTFDAQARVVAGEHEQRLARDLLFEKYSAGYKSDLTSWRESALPVAIDLSCARSHLLASVCSERLRDAVPAGTVRLRLTGTKAA